MSEITLFFTAIAALMMVALAVHVILRRTAAGVSLGDGGDAELQRRIRMHGNFVEHMPLALGALAGAELTGAAPVLVWVLGLVLLAGRVAHAIALKSGIFWMRPLGMGLTFTATGAAALLTLWALCG